MKATVKFLANALLAGAIVLIPIYLVALLLLKVAGSLRSVVEPMASYLPESLPAEHALSFLFVLIACFVVGVVVRSPIGHAAWEGLEKGVLQRIPAYSLVRSLTQQVTHESDENVWKPALVEIEDALAPAFIIEEIDDERVTVFVPSVPTPFAGAVYILARERVHAVDVPFTKALKTIARWGSGSKDLVAAMQAGPLRKR